MDELESIFNEAQELFRKLEDERTPEKVTKCLALFQEAADLVSRENIYSKNEELDDVRTDLLPYLLLDFYLAQLTMQIFDDKRIQTLEKAKLLYRKFFTTAYHFKLLRASDLEYLEGAERLGGNQRREAAIGRHQRHSEVKARLASLAHQRLASPADEELSREHTLALLESAVVEGMNEWGTLAMELDMLKKVTQMRENGQDPLDPRLKPKSAGVPNVRILPNGKVVPLTPQPDALKGVAQAQRQQVKGAAFTPTNLPSVSLEQFYQIMADRNANTPAAEEAPHRGSSESDDDDDEKLKKAREWDDFKDDNPKGSGNRNGNIG